jgi:hypothetical protein
MVIFAAHFISRYASTREGCAFSGLARDFRTFEGKGKGSRNWEFEDKAIGFVQASIGERVGTSRRRKSQKTNYTVTVPSPFSSFHGSRG